jgi:hypothetical protein
MISNGKGIYERDIENVEMVKWFIFTRYYLILTNGKRVRVKKSVGKMLYDMMVEYDPGISSIN